MSLETSMIKEINKPLVFEKTFTNFDQPWVAVDKAEKFCEQHGFCVGPIQGNEPRGIANCNVLKWRNLGEGDRSLLNGVMVSKNFRFGSVTLKLAIKLSINEKFPIEHTQANVTLIKHEDGYTVIFPPSIGIRNLKTMRAYINAMNASLARMEELSV